MYASISDFFYAVSETFDEIPAKRRALLDHLSAYIRRKHEAERTTQLIIICTHNSRRSHIGQFMLAAAAEFYGATGIATYSGGTEATAFNPNAITALLGLGFEITTGDASVSNPRYGVSWSAGRVPAVAFSKKYEERPNPQEQFGAIMVCSEADEGCPFVPGADFRLALPFDDPKAFDGTPLQTQKYDERAREIGREMLYVMSRV